ncbi:MAG: MFS transporter [Actinobacteria bacterium]|nr:MFS transporter [Actinomycetota bacterium]
MVDVSTKPKREARLAAIAALAFSLAMGTQSVLLPLLALAAGYSKPDVGILTAISAIAQLFTRILSATAMRRFSDKTLVVLSGIVLAVSSISVALSSFVVVFVIAELIQGIARGLFWSSATTHVLRQEGPTVGLMATINFLSSFGLFAGPTVAGLIAKFSLSTALVVAGVIALTTVIPAVLLSKEPPFEKGAKKIKREIWGKSEVRLGSWAGMTAGSWRGILNSYVPVVLRSVGDSYFLVGVLVSMANGASILGTGLMGLLKRRSPIKVFALGVAMAAIGTGFVGITAKSIFISLVILVAGGVGAGLLQTLGPVIATAGVETHQKGDAVALAGSFRAGALLGAPLLMAVLLGPIGLSAALLVSGAVLGLPILTARNKLRPRQAS